MSARRKWIDMGNGLRVQRPTKVAAAFHRQQQVETRAMERQQQANTCGLGRWEQPEDWNRLAYSHTVTHVDANSDHWLPYVTGCTVELDVHPIEGPFTRGAAYVWCKRTRENGNVMFPTAPLFGRFIELAGSRPKVLAGEGRQEVVDADYVYCFRAVGVLHGSGSSSHVRKSPSRSPAKPSGWTVLLPSTCCSTPQSVSTSS